jgi:hypothetical protein
MSEGKLPSMLTVPIHEIIISHVKHTFHMSMKDQISYAQILNFTYENMKCTF